MLLKSVSGIGPKLAINILSHIPAAELKSAIAAGDVSRQRLEQYPKEWHDAEGKNHERLYKIKQAVYKFTDEELNRTAEAVLAMKPQERTLINVFKAALLRHPSLIFEVLKVFMS